MISDLAPISSALDTTLETDQEFFTYPLDEQDRFRDLWDAMRIIDRARFAAAGCRAVAAAHPGREGWSAGRLHARYMEWKKNPHWTVFIDRRRFPDFSGEDCDRAAFLRYVKELFCENKRKNEPAHRKLIRQWEAWYRTGDPQYAIPGYKTAPPPCGRHPYGWSYENLNRYAKLPRAELIIARIGSDAGSNLLPHIPGTREGCRFMEFIAGDDVECDRKVCVPGFSACKILQFGVMDYATAVYLKFIQRPMIPRADGTNEKLKRRDFLWLIAMLLEEYGYPLDYVMHIICERGTATMSVAEARFLYEVSNGHIVVCYSSMEGTLVHAWEEKKIGNSKAKGWLESFHNLYHNESADLAGQMGKDRDHSPTALPAMERAQLALDNAAAILPAMERARLRMPFPSQREAYADSLARVAWINDRKDHDCEGFEQVMEWSLRGASMFPQPEGALADFLAKNPRLTIDDLEWHPRPESPMERLARLSAGVRFQKLHPAIWQRFYEGCHVLKTVREDYAIEFDLDGRKHRFMPDSPDNAIKPGTEVLGYYRPMDFAVMHIFVDGRYVVTWPREKKVHRVGPHAEAEKAAAFKRKQSFFNQAIANVRDATAPEIERMRADAANNEVVLAENGLIQSPGIMARTIAETATTATADALVAACDTRDNAASKAKAAKRRARECKLTADDFI